MIRLSVASSARAAFSVAAVRDSIALGRTGVMPAFGERLDATEIKLLTAWLAAGARPLRGQ